MLPRAQRFRWRSKAGTKRPTSPTSTEKEAVRRAVMAVVIAVLAGVVPVVDAAAIVAAVGVVRAGRQRVVSGQLSVVRNRLWPVDRVNADTTAMSR